MKICIVSVIALFLFMVNGVTSAAPCYGGGECGVDACEFTVTDQILTILTNYPIICYDANGNPSVVYTTVYSYDCVLKTRLCYSATEVCDRVAEGDQEDFCVPDVNDLALLVNCAGGWKHMNGQGSSLKICCC